MKKKVVIEKVPTKSSKKKVVIESLPKAQMGITTTGRDPQIVNQTQNLLLDKIKRDNEKSKLGITSSARAGDYDLMMQNQKMLQDKIEADNAKIKGGFKKFGDAWKNTKFQVPHFYPLIGNRYLQEAVMDFNDAATFASNIGKAPKDITLPAPNYNPYANIYWTGAHGGMLPIYQNAGLVEEDPMITEQTLPLQTSYSLEDLGTEINNPYKFDPGLTKSLQKYYKKQGVEVNPTLNPEEQKQYDEYNKSNLAKGFGTAGAIAGTVAKIGSGITKGIKGGADIAGNIAQNRAAQLAQNQLYTQSVFSDAMNVTPYETQGYGFTGRNSLAADGMQIKQIGGYGEPNVEVEGDEHIQLPNGFSQEIKGKKHSEGGIPLNLPQGTKIFSEKLKDPETKKSYADLAKKFETKKYVDLLNSKDADPIQKATAQMMIKQKNAKLEELFSLQEQNKLSGVHGPKVQQNAEQELAQSQGEMQEEPMMMHGGYHLPKAQAGSQFYTKEEMNNLINFLRQGKGGFRASSTARPTAQSSSGYKEGIWSGDIYASQNPKINIPFAPETSRTWNAMTDFKDIKDYANAVGYTGELNPKDIPGTNLKIQKFVGENYPELVEKYHSGSFYGLPSAKTPYDSKLGVRWQAIAKDIQGMKKPGTQQITTPAAPTVEKEPENKPNTPAPIQQINKTYEIPGMGIGIGLPNVYGRLPLNYYKIEPNYIDPRYLDIQPQLNRIGRAQRAIETTLGSRGASDMANLLQAQANRAAAEQEAFGQKYNYDRAQDAAAQQFNAQAKQAIDQYNQQSWYQQLEDPIRRRESAIETQKMMDNQAAIENARKMQAFYGNKEFIGDTFFPAQNWNMQDVISELPKYSTYAYQKGLEEGTKKAEKKKKYGGKVKIKPKLKK